jgi:hypothetical protein
MTWFGESIIEGGSRAITGSTGDAAYAYREGIGSFGFVYGAGLLVVPLLYGVTFISLQLKIMCSVLMVLITLAVYKAGYSILIIVMAIAGVIYVAAKVGLKQRVLSWIGVILIGLLICATVKPQIFSFLAKPLLHLEHNTSNPEYQMRINSIADSLSGAEGTYAEYRASVYWASWRVFLKYPLFGGGSGEYRRPAPDMVSGHSTVFDTLGFYGLFGLTLYLLFFVYHYRYLRVMSAVVIGYKWWPSYYIYMISATAVMFINPFSGVPLLMSLCLYLPALPLLFKKEQRVVGIQTVANRPNRFRSQPG